MCVDGVYAGEESVKKLNTVICEHLFRQGKLEIGERVMKVSSTNMSGLMLVIFPLGLEHVPSRISDICLKGLVSW